MNREENTNISNDPISDCGMIPNRIPLRKGYTKNDESADICTTGLSDLVRTAYIQSVEISYWYGRNGNILELYVPTLECSFNESAGFCQERGNVILSGRRGHNIATVVLSEEQYETLRIWRNIEKNYRDEVEPARQVALDTCFGSFQNRSAKLPKRLELSCNDENFQDMILKGYNVYKLEKERKEEFYRTTFYILAGIRPPNFVVSLLLKSSRKRFLTALMIQRNIRILYRRYKQRKCEATA